MNSNNTLMTGVFSGLVLTIAAFGQSVPAPTLAPDSAPAAARGTNVADANLLRNAGMTVEESQQKQETETSGIRQLFMDRLDVDDVQFPIFDQNSTTTTLRNSRVHLAVVGDAIGVKRGGFALIARRARKTA